MKLPRTSYALAAPVLVISLVSACGGENGDLTAQQPKSLEERLFSGNEADFAKQQQLIRECMVGQGFEYTPADTRDAGGPPRPDPDSEDFVKEYGFGISTLFSSEIRFDPSDDPNSVYRNSLSDSQKKAYDLALYGQSFGDGTFSSSGGGAVVAIPIGGGPGSEGGEDGPKLAAPAGCVGEALKATGVDTSLPDSGLFDELNDLEDRIKADPKMVAAMKKWSACMADAGYQYRDRDAAIKELREEFGELTGLKISGDSGGFVVSVSASAEGGSDGEGKAFDPLANVDKAKLTQLQEKEKRIASASLKCSEEHVVSVEQKVREGYEADFLADHPELKDK